MDERREPSDGEIVRKVLAGEAELFGVLVERYRHECGRLAAALVGDRDAGADALQEAFIRAWRALDRCRDPERFRSWFYRIVVNQCHDARRRRKETPLDDVELAAKDTADGVLVRTELAAALERSLGLLTPEQREAFVMKEIEGRSYAEMTELLGTGVDALKMRVHRARDALRKELGGLLG